MDVRMLIGAAQSMLEPKWQQFYVLFLFYFLRGGRREGCALLYSPKGEGL